MGTLKHASSGKLKYLRSSVWLMWQAFQHNFLLVNMFTIGSIFIKIQGHKRIILKSKYVLFLMNPLSFTELLNLFLNVLHHSSIWKLLLAKLLVLHKNNTYFLIDSYPVICVVEDISISTLFQSIPLITFSVSTVEMCQCSSTLISVQVLLYPPSFLLSFLHI